MQLDGVVAVPVDNRERWLSVPFFQFIDRVMDLPVVRAALVLAVFNCAEDRGDSRGVPVPQRQVPAVLDPSWRCLRFSSSSACRTFLLCYSKLCRRPQRSRRCVCSSWWGVTCPSLCNHWRRGSGQCCSALAVERRRGRGRQAAFVCIQPGVGAHHAGDEPM